MNQRRNVTPWFPVAVDPVHEGIYEVEYRYAQVKEYDEVTGKTRRGEMALPVASLKVAQ